MSNPAQEIKIETFRQQRQAELNEGNEYLSGWLERWAKEGKVVSESRKPWASKGRVYSNFYETFYNVLNWYKLWKISRFRQIGWKIDPLVVENIKDKFARLVNCALETKNDGRFHEYFKSYDPAIISYYTAIDYEFQNITGSRLNNILDFGSGIGRQAFQWASQEGINFFSVDAIESLYMLQNKIYSLLFQDKLYEYFCNPERFKKRDFYSDTNKLYHLPTWRIDFLPDEYFDLIICVQVLQEINEKTLRYVLAQFKRIIKKNGILYIRDNEFWQPNHKLRVARELLSQGWELIFKYNGQEGIDIEGLPRLWAFTGTDNRKYFRNRTRIKRVFLPSHPFSYRSWRDYGLPI